MAGIESIRSVTSGLPGWGAGTTPEKLTPGLRAQDKAFLDQLDHLNKSRGVALEGPTRVGDVGPAAGAANVSGLGATEASGRLPSFQEVLSQLVQGVDAKQDVAQADVRRLMTGESDNLHQAMISMQESGLAFTLMVEVRNKLVEGFQEIMRMQI